MRANGRKWDFPELGRGLESLGPNGSVEQVLACAQPRPRNEKTKKCECGCGSPVPIAKHDDRRWGHVKGEPIRFVLGHNNPPGRCVRQGR